MSNYERISEVLLKLRKRIGATQQEIADRIEVSSRQYHKIEKTGKTTIETLNRLADVFEVDIIVFFTGKGASLSAPLQLYKVPIVNSIPASGFTKSFEDMVLENYILTDVSIPGSVALCVVGDSMAPKIENGDTAIVVPDMPFENNKIYAVIANDSEATLKVVKKAKGGYYCIPLNPAYETMFVIEPEMIRLYKLVQVVKNIK